MTVVHNLSGPVAVEGAEPGDCLVVDILDGVHISFLGSFSRSLNVPIMLSSAALRQDAMGLHCKLQMPTVSQTIFGLTLL